MASIGSTDTGLSSVVAVVAAKLGRPVISDDQMKIINNYKEGKDVFVSLPTGAGKSLSYMVAPFVADWAKTGVVPRIELEASASKPKTKLKSCVIIVSPLVAIMEEHNNFLM